ncbi:hypothetical protein TWF730_002250 [Orbilia blumenaviensis]|uniref:Uncharacterized protein n=1 Tax=Orbilia blumenaviensis TaxID=1796055 RepID=A0AAV9U9H5_9PEZI
MYSLQLRRGIARGRIWHSSALYQPSQLLEDGCFSVYASGQQHQQQIRGFRGSRELYEEEKKDEDDKPAAAAGAAAGGEGDAKPRVIPKMNFAELMKKASTLRQSVFKKPPEASAAFNPTAPPPSANAAPSQATTTTTTTPPPSSQTAYKDTPSTSTPQPQEPTVRFGATGPRIRRSSVSEIPTDLIAGQQFNRQQQSDQAASDRRAARLARHKARLLQESAYEQQQQKRDEPQPLTISDREAQAQERAFAQAGSFVRGYSESMGGAGGGRGGGAAGGFKIKRMGTMPGDPRAMPFQDRLRMARVARGDGRGRQQQQQDAFEEDGEEGEVRQMPGGGPRITTLPVRTGAGAGAGAGVTGIPRGPRTARAQGPRGARGGGGGGGGGRGRGRGRRSAKLRASLREQERQEEIELDAMWNATTANPQPAPEGTVEPHPVYDSTKPYTADIGDLSRWIPAMGAGNSVGAKKLQWVGKPKGEKMLEYASKALLGDGILIPGEVFKPTGVQKGKVTDEVEKALGIAEAGVMRNPTFGGKNRLKFLEVVRGKVGLGQEARP